jgi:type VI secretion system protein
MPPPRVITPQNPAEIDFDALIGDLSSLQLQGTAAPSSPTPGAPTVHGSFAELDNSVSRDVPSAAVATQAAEALTPDAGRVALRAFLEGAGIANPSVSEDPETALRNVGRVFRALTEGLREILMSRAAIKGELRVEQTLLKPSNNNALKFSFTPEDAIIALLSAGRPGYMPPLGAVREAFDDIKTHEIAVMAGVQTALMGLLRRFDPEALEARLAQGSIASIVPAARKARLWDSFCELHRTIAGEAEDDFQAVFGRAFAKTYKQQSRKD